MTPLKVLLDPPKGVETHRLKTTPVSFSLKAMWRSHQKQERQRWRDPLLGSSSPMRKICRMQRLDQMISRGLTTPCFSLGCVLTRGDLNFLLISNNELKSSPCLFYNHPRRTSSKKITIQMPWDIVLGLRFSKQNTPPKQNTDNKNLYKIQKLNIGETSLSLETAHHQPLPWDCTHIPYPHMSCGIWNLKIHIYKI